MLPVQFILVRLLHGKNNVLPEFSRYYCSFIIVNVGKPNCKGEVNLYVCTYEIVDERQCFSIVKRLNDPS